MEALKTLRALRVANYYRVSTTLQAKEDRFSLAAQKTELKAYVKKQEWRLVNEFVDIETGGKLDKKGLNGLLDLVESGEIDIVLCMDQDRLSRLDTVSWEYLKSVLRDNDVKIAEPNGILTDLSNEDDVFFSDIKNLFAQREKRKTVNRMMYGKRQRLREGKGWGVCPFEYYYEKGFYYIKDGWSWTISAIDDMYLNKNYGYTKIAKELTKISKTPSGKDWNEHLIYTRLNSKCFHGVQEMTFANGETIAAKVYEPMRTEETYNKIQVVRGKRREQFSISTRVSTENIGLLKYVPLTCGYCGRVLFTHQNASKAKPKYITRHGRAKSIKTEQTCDIHINAKRYEYNLTLALKEILTGEELSKKYIHFESNEEELHELKSKVKKEKQVLNRLSAAKDKLLDLYLNTDDLDKEVYLEKEKDLTTKIELSSSQIKKHETKIEIINKKEWNYEALYQYILVAERIGVNLTRHEQANIMKKLFTKGVLTEDKLVLTTEIYNGVPIDITIPVVDNTRTVNKWMRRDKRNNEVIYVG